MDAYTILKIAEAKREGASSTDKAVERNSSAVGVTLRIYAARHESNKSPHILNM